jgi:UDP-GlcNAc3NAcA epimerase
MKIVTVLGARPQFIKAATLSRSFARHNDVREVIIHTGQHYDEKMSDIFFEEMQIPKPDHFLHVSSKLHGEMTGRMLTGVEQIIITERPDCVLVYGDTNSTLAGALAAAKLHVPIAHVEAGLRSFNRKMPEEVNRVLTDHMSSLLFAPTRTAVDNLQKEGVAQDTVHFVGDVMYDAVQFYKPIAERQSTIIRDLGVEGKPFILVTIHRAENTNDPARLNAIFAALHELSSHHTVILPLHPRTKSLLHTDYAGSNFRIIDPVGYFDMMCLQSACRLIVTDSGGVQKEAYFHGKYCITVREETEWVELVDKGYNFLARPLSVVSPLVGKLWNQGFPQRGEALYGDGSAADKIVSIIKKG